MERLEVSTLVYLPREEVYDFLLDFPRYAAYSEYLREVTGHGDGGAGTRYDLHFAWWRLSHTVESEVTEVNPPSSIHWRVLGRLTASGRWEVESAADETPADRETASRVRLIVEYDADTVDDRLLDVPRLVSLSWVVDRATGLVVDEGERVVERVVADLEGEPREVDLEVRGPRRV